MGGGVSRYFGGGFEGLQSSRERRLRARYGGGRDREYVGSLCREAVENGQCVMVFCSSKANSESLARLLAALDVCRQVC